MASTNTPTTTFTTEQNLNNQSDFGVSCRRYTSIQYTVTALILVLALLGNGFICVAFMTRRKLRTVTNYFVMNLAVADFLLIIQWFILVMFTVFCEPLLNVPLLTTMELIISTASVVGLAVVNYDRFYAVNHALHYGSTMTHGRAVMAIVAVWVYSTVTAFIQWGALADRSIIEIYLRVYSVVLFVCNFFLPFLISAYCYVRIFLIAMLHLRHGVPANQLCDPFSKASTVRKQLKISLNIFILAVPFLFVWNAYYGITVYEELCVPFGCKPVIKRFSMADFFVSNLPQMVAAINPIIFICLTKDLRSTAMMCLRCSTNSRRRGDRLGQSENYSTATKYTTNYQDTKRDSISKL